MTRVFRPGVFDLLHVGHIACIRDAAAQGSCLIVGVQDDRDVAIEKGKKPVVPLVQRMELLRAVRGVDQVISYRNANLSKLLAFMEIDVLAVGDDYGNTDGQRATLTYCQTNGITVHRTPRTTGVSSTAFREKIDFWKTRPVTGAPTDTMLTSGHGQEDWQRQETEREVEIISSYLTPHTRALDLGCGSGRLAVPLADKCYGITCVDSSPAMIAKLEAVNHPAIHATCQDVVGFRLLSERGQYHIIVASGLFPCLNDSDFARLTHDLRRLVIPKGRLLVRSSVGDPERVDVIDQYSDGLNSLYTAYYRTVGEINTALAAHFEPAGEPLHLYANHTDTRVVFMAYQRKG